MKVVVISDTHIRPGGARRLPDALYKALGDADAVLHAGDIVTRDVLDELSGFAPVHAVLGNNDDGVLAGMLPETLNLELGAVRVGMIHDSGSRDGRPRRMRRRFPDSQIVVYGHSHIPYCGEGLEGQLLFNPGSPTERRAQPHHTYGVLDLRDGEIAAADIIEI